MSIKEKSSAASALPDRGLSSVQSLVLTLALITVAAGFMIFSQKGKAIKGFDVDDAGITYNFATRLAEGYGIVLYPGGERVEGYSNPSWMFLLAAGISLGFDPSPLAWFLGHVFGALTLIFLALFAVRAGPDRTFGAAIFAPLLLGAHAGFILWNLNGMENSLYTFLLVAGIYRLWRECDADTKTRWPIAPFLFFLLAITRPEGIVYFGFAGFYRLITVTLRKKRVGLSDVLWMLAFVLPYAAYQVCITSTLRGLFQILFTLKSKTSPFYLFLKGVIGAWSMFKITSPPTTSIIF